jgi:hypothetical protein
MLELPDLKSWRDDVGRCPMLIHCVSLTALAMSAFAPFAAAVPLAFPVGVASSADSVDGLTALPPGMATLTQTLLDIAQTSRSTSGGTLPLPPDFFRHRVGPPHSSVLRVRTPQPAVQSGSVDGGNLLTFFVGGEPVALLTEDQTWDVILGTTWISVALPFYDYVTDVQQEVQVKDTTIGTDAPAISTYVLGPRVIGGLAGVGLLAAVVLVAVYLKRSVKRHVPRPVPGSEGKGGRGSEPQEYRRAYAEHLGVNSDGASSTDFAMLGLRHPFTRQDVQRAFRAKSQRLHPDHGGDPDFFRSLVSARDRALADADDEGRTPGASPS